MYVFSDAYVLMCPHAPFSNYFYVPRTQMTQLHSLLLLKYLRHRTSNPEGRWQACRLHCPRDIMVYPCPVLDLAHLAIGTDRIASLCLPPDNVYWFLL